jgi:G patch domain/KOW motif-containing protein
MAEAGAAGGPGEPSGAGLGAGVSLVLKRAAGTRRAAAGGADLLAGSDSDDGQQESEALAPTTHVIPLQDSGASAADGPILLRNRPLGLAEVKDERLRFHKDVEQRPELDDAQYRQVRIEDFGAAMLRGMGWKEDAAAGEEGKAAPRAFVTEARPAQLGLGAMPKPELREQVRAKSSSGGGGSSSWLCDDAVVRVTAGRHEGEVAVVKQADGVPGLNNVVLYLDPGADAGLLAALPEVMVSRSAVQLVFSTVAGVPPEGAALLRRAQRERAAARAAAEAADWAPRPSAEPAPAAERGSESSGSERERHSSSNKSGKEDKKRRKKEHKSKHKHHKRSRSDSSGSEGRHGHGKRAACWLRTGIRVRVVSRSLGAGAHYAHKGVVQDVLDARRCTCLLVLGEGAGRVTLDGVAQSQLETALPKSGGTVAVLAGPRKGELATLMERDAEAGRATVQMRDDKAVLRLAFDEVAEYCFAAEEGEDEA